MLCPNKYICSFNIFCVEENKLYTFLFLKVWWNYQSSMSTRSHGVLSFVKFLVLRWLLKDYWTIGFKDKNVLSFSATKLCHFLVFKNTWFLELIDYQNLWLRKSERNHSCAFLRSFQEYSITKPNLPKEIWYSVNMITIKQKVMKHVCSSRLQDLFKKKSLSSNSVRYSVKCRGFN